MIRFSLVLLLFTAYSPSGLCQSSEIFFKAELLAFKESKEQGNFDEAIRHLEKAKSYMTDDGQKIQVEARYIEVFIEKKEFLLAEESLNQLLASGLDVSGQIPNLQELRLRIQEGAEQEKRRILVESEKIKAWERARNSGTMEALRSYIDQYPESDLSMEAKKMIGDLYLKNIKIPFSYDDSRYLQFYENWDTLNSVDEQDEIFALKTNKVPNNRTYKSLVYLFLENSQIEDFSQLSAYLEKNNSIRALQIDNSYFFNRNELQEKIRHPFSSPNMRLFRLHNCNISSISEIGFPLLSYLDLSQNRLSSFPIINESIKLTIEYLNLGVNQFETIPPTVLSFQNLKYLNIRENELKALPDKIASLQKLKHFDGSFNPFKTIPPYLYDLKDLETLYLFGLQCDFLPLGIENLTKLESLGIGGNVKALPKGLDLGCSV